MDITPEQLGRRIKRIRVDNGFSQEDIAKILKIPRSSVVQMEKGNRQISVIELTELSQRMGFSLDWFLSAEYETASSLEIVAESQVETELDVIRDPVPKLRRIQLESVILYITGKCGAYPRMDINLLTNMLYFCDFDHYELHEEQLSGLSYTKQTFGPYPENITRILKEMEAEGKLQRLKSNYRGIPQIKYLPLVQADLMKISAAGKEVIDHVIERFSQWPASALNAFSREDMPFKATKQGDHISYELAFYREQGYSARIYDEDWYE